MLDAFTLWRNCLSLLQVCEFRATTRRTAGDPRRTQARVYWKQLLLVGDVRQDEEDAGAVANEA